MEEFEFITKWIEDCNIPVEISHGDSDAKNMIFNKVLQKY